MKWHAVLFTLVFGFYLWGAQPSVAVGDAGEYIAASSILGTPHAPGYPLQTLLGRLFQVFIPWGNPAYRVNLLSAACMAGAVLIIAMALTRRINNFPMAWGAALLFGLAPVVVKNSGVTEVFALHALLAAAFLAAILAERWIMAGWVFGLAAAHHQTIALLVPGALIQIYPSWRAGQISSRQILIVSTAFAVVCALYALPFLRAFKNPILNWDDPDTLGKLWHLVSRSDYGSLTLALGDPLPRTLAYNLKHTQRFFKEFTNQWGTLGLTLFSLGIVFAWRKDRWTAASLTVSWVLSGVAFLWLGNLPFNAQSTGILERFYILPLICGAYLLGIGLQALPRAAQLIGAAALAIVIGMMGYRSVGFPDRHDFREYAYGRNTLRSLPPQSLLFIDGGDDTFYSLAYLTLSEKRRRDVELHDRGGLVYPNPYGSDFRQLPRELKEVRRQEIEKAALSSSRPLIYATMNAEILSGVPLKQTGLVYSAEAAAPQQAWELYDLRDIAPWGAFSQDTPQDYRLRALVPFYAYQRAAESFQRGETKAALSFASTSNSLGRDVLWLEPNLWRMVHWYAFQLYQQKKLALAEQCYRWLVRLRPSDGVAWTNLGALLEQQKQPEAALDAYEKGVAADPTNVEARFNLAVALWQRSRWKEVVAHLEEVLRLNPQHARARFYLDRAKSHLL